MTVLKRIGIVAAAAAWFVLVFLASLWLTFPTQSIVDRVRFAVQEATRGQTVLELGSVRPGFFAVAADEVKVYQRDRVRRGGETPPAKEILALDGLSVRAWPLSLYRLATGSASDASVSGSATLSGGDLDFSATIAKAEDKMAIHALTISGAGFPLAALPSFDGTTRLEGTGGLDVDIDLGGTSGMAKSDGHFVITGKDLSIDKIVSPGSPVDGFGPVSVPTVDLRVDVTGGKGKVSSGHIETSLLSCDVDGDITLLEDLMQSRLRLKATCEAAPDQVLVAGLLKQATWDEDSKAHYSVTGTLSHPRFRPERDRKATIRGPALAGGRRLHDQNEPPVPADDNGPPPGPPGPPPGLDIAPPLGGGPPEDDAARADRQRAREEAIAERRERLRLRREAEGQDGPVRPGTRLDEDAAGPRDFPPDDGGPPDDAGLPPDDEGPPPDDGGPPPDDGGEQ